MMRHLRVVPNVSLLCAAAPILALVMTTSAAFAQDFDVVITPPPQQGQAGAGGFGAAVTNFLDGVRGAFGGNDAATPAITQDAVPLSLVLEAFEAAEQERQEYLQALRDGPAAVARLQADRNREGAAARIATPEELQRWADEEVAQAEGDFDRAYERYVAAYTALKESPAGDVFRDMDAATREAAELLLAGAQGGPPAEKIGEWLARDVILLSQNIRANWIAITDLQPAKERVENAIEAQVAAENPIIVEVLKEALPTPQKADGETETAARPVEQTQEVTQSAPAPANNAGGDAAGSGVIGFAGGWQDTSGDTGGVTGTLDTETGTFTGVATEAGETASFTLDAVTGNYSVIESDGTSDTGTFSTSIDAAAGAFTYTDQDGESFTLTYNAENGTITLADDDGDTVTIDIDFSVDVDAPGADFDIPDVN